MSMTWGDYVSYKARAEAAEAECARLQQALWAEVLWQEEEYGSRHPARDILEGPDTPADSQPEMRPEDDLLDDLLVDSQPEENE